MTPHTHPDNPFAYPLTHPISSTADVSKQAMERDIEANLWQHGTQRLKKMAETYRALAPDQRLVEMPQ